MRVENLFIFSYRNLPGIQRLMLDLRSNRIPIAKTKHDMTGAYA